MKKSIFIERIARRASERYGVTIDQAWLDDMVACGLIREGERLANNGRQPTYDYDWTRYRRALQLVRFRKAGIVEKDALRIQLFLRGYSFPEWDVAEALSRQWDKYGRAIINQVRSGFADNQKSIGEKHKISFIRQLGALDSRFDKTDLRLPDDTYIEGLRAAKQGPIIDNFPSQSLREVEEFFRTKPSFQDVAARLLPQVMSGMLMFGADPDDKSTEIDSIEKLIRSSDHDTYKKARKVYRLMTCGALPAFWGIIDTNASPDIRQQATSAIIDSIRDRPEWATIMLVLCLRLARENPSFADFPFSTDDCTKILNLLSYFNEKGPQNSNK